MNNNRTRHFDPLRNKLPPNWTNKSATDYSNRCWWKKCKCELRINPCDDCTTGDKWDPCGTCESKWTKGCNPCSDFHKADKKYFYTYNRKNCGCSEKDPNDKDCSCKSYKSYGSYSYDKSDYKPHEDCGCDEDVVIRFVANNAAVACDDLVELRFPPGGTKERYAAQFSEEFINNNRFQCVIPAVYNNCPNNVIDNRREEEFTVSDQKALVSRNIRNRILAERVTTRRRHKHSIPMSTAQNGTYYYIGGSGNRQGSNMTGLYGPHITGKPYFDLCNC